MNKLIFFFGLLFLISTVSAGVIIPTSLTSEMEQTSLTQKVYRNYNYPKYFFNDLNELDLIDSNIQNSASNWDYEVSKGIYKFKARNDGTFQFNHKNDLIEIKLLGLIFFNVETKQRINKLGINFSNPTIEENRIIWQLPADSNYIIYYENKTFRDVLTISESVKQYLKNNRPQGWNLQNTLIGVLYDLNIQKVSDIDIDGNAVLNDFETYENINFIQNGQTVHSIKKSFVLHADYNHGFNGMEFEVNEHLRWIKLKKYLKQKNKYLEVIDANSLWSQNGAIVFNSSITVNVPQSNFDGYETNFGTIITNTEILPMILLNYGSATGFKNITVEQGTTISNARLRHHITYSCDFTPCYNIIYGESADDGIFIDSTDNSNISDRNKTVAYTSWDITGTFAPNGFYSTSDINVTQQVQEIINRTGWASDNNMFFIMERRAYPRDGAIGIIAYDHVSYPASQLTIDFEVDPCLLIYNFDWIINVECYFKDVEKNTGKGITYIGTAGKLGLTNSFLLTKSFVSCAFSGSPAWCFLLNDANFNVHT